MKFDISNINKSYLIAGSILIVVVIAVTVISLSSSGREEASVNTEPTQEPQKREIVPTVDASVQVDLEGIDNNRSVMLTIENAPDGTEEVEASITYFRVESSVDEPVQDGSFQLVEIENGEGEVEMLLGTESSGVKRYHELSDGEIRVEMLFIGEYGEQIYQNDFQLDL